MKNIKRYFLTGIIVLAPVGITLWLLYLMARFVVRTFHVGIFPHGLPDYIPAPEWLHAAMVVIFESANFFVGLVFALLLTLVVGALVRTYVGKKFITFGESLIERIPFFRSVYNAVKQLTEAVFVAEKGRSFNRVVLIEYPRKGIHSLGFVTGPTKGKIATTLEGRKMINIFIPSTPNPTTGYYLVVPKEDAIEMDLTPEEAFKLIISGGLAADGEKSRPPEKTQDKKGS